MSSRKVLPIVLFAVLLLGNCAFADGPELEVHPDSLFFRQVGNTAPPSQQVALTAEGGTLGAFTAAASSTGNWLSVSPTSGSGRATLTVSVNTASLAPGEYRGTITITATGFSNSKRVRVELEILPAGTAVLVVRPHELEFHAVEGGPAPASQSVQIFNTLTASFNWTATATVQTPQNGRWLSVTPASGSGNGVLQVRVDPTGLSRGEYNGRITVASGSASVQVTVELEIEAGRPAHLVINPQAFNFVVEPNATQLPRPKTLRVKNSGAGILNWTATATVETPPSGTWLSISPSSGSTPAEITVRVNPGTLPPGMYSGKITVSATGAGSADAKVFLRILGPSRPSVVVTPKSLHFTFSNGSVTPSSRTVDISSRTTGLTFTATATTARGGSWLNVTPGSGNVPGSITVSVRASVAATLSAGVYTGNIEVRVPGAAQVVHNVHVSLRIPGPSETARLEVEPGGLAFTARVGGSNPAPKMVEVENESAASISWTTTVSTSSGGNWLSVSPTSGTLAAGASTQVTISATLGTLAVGTYSGTVVFTPSAASGAPPVSVRVTLVVSAAAGRTPADSEGLDISVSAEAAAGGLVALFTEPSNGFISNAALPLNVSVKVLGSTGAGVEGAAVIASSSNVEPDLVLTDVGNGQYSGVFRPLSSGPLTLTGLAVTDTQATDNFAVSVDMEAATVKPTVIFQNGAVSAASLAPGPTPLAPGSLLSLFGLSLAGNAGVATSIPLPTNLGGVTVTIGGVSAPLIFAGSAGGFDQINLQVPFEVEGTQADVVVNNNGVLTTAETINLAAAVPALFTVSQTGVGGGAFVHALTGAMVTASNPATAGETISLFATGLGALQTPIATGSALPGGTDSTVGNVTVTIGGQPVEQVLYAGAAPFFVGLYQINVIVPSGLPPGDSLVVVSVDGVSTTGQATLATQ